MKARNFTLFVVWIGFFSVKNHVLAMYMDAQQEGTALFQSIIDHGLAEYALVDEAAAKKEARDLISESLGRHLWLTSAEESKILETGFMLALKNNLFWLASLYYAKGAYRGSDPYSHTTCRLSYPLDTVVQEGTDFQLQFLLKLGARPIPCWCMEECCLRPPLQSCIDHQSEEQAARMVRLMAKEVGVNYAGKKPLHGTALHNAAGRGSMSLIKLLVELGANPNSTAIWSSATPLNRLVLNMHSCDNARLELFKFSCKLLFQYGALCKKEDLSKHVSPEFMQECKQARADFLLRQKIHDQIARRADYKQVGPRPNYYREFYLGQLDKAFGSLQFKPEPELAKPAGVTKVVGVKMPAPLVAIIADYSGNLAAQEEFGIMENRYTREPEKTCVVQ